MLVFIEAVTYSPKEDKNMSEQFCLKLFYEAKFIALKGLKLPDLLYEISKYRYFNIILRKTEWKGSHPRLQMR